MIFDLDDLNLLKNEPLKDNPGVPLHPPTKFGEDQPKDLEGLFQVGGLNLNVQKINPSRTTQGSPSSFPLSLVKIGPKTGEDRSE